MTQRVRPAAPSRATGRASGWSHAGAVLACLVLLLPVPSPAHDSPEHVVEQLTAEMDRDGRSAARLCERAVQFRELGRLAEAEADLAAALEAQPDNLGTANDLARVQWHRGQAARALTTLKDALAHAATPEEQSPLLLTRAEIRTAQGAHTEALADCDRAFGGGATPDLDWYLLRAQLQVRAGRAADAAAGLKSGFEHTGNAVLEAEWIEALIDAGRARDALDRIEAPLADSRWRSSWLLRRARARLALGDATRARGDLHAAIRELNTRLEGSTRPDPSLLLDRGSARALLGDLDAARQDLKAARAAGAEPISRWRLEARLDGVR